MHVERFAPSPTGLLHLGHAYSAHMAYQAARAANGRFLVRLEDLDTARVRPAYAAAIEDDLRWLGLTWEGPILCQSTRLPAYADALESLISRGLVYACDCSRRDINEAASAPQEGATTPMPDLAYGPAYGPDGLVYPGTCRHKRLPRGPDVALRLDMQAAVEWLGGREAVQGLAFREIGAGPAGETGRIALDPAALVGAVGDIVLRRRDGVPAYHLAVVVDDAFQSVTHVTRGQDLFSATPIHRLLQALLGVPTPVYHHHALVRDGDGKRLAKRDDARAIARYREDGLGPAQVLELARAATGSAASVVPRSRR